MKHNEGSIEKRDELLKRLWINLVGDAEGFEGETARDKRILMDLVGKSSFVWTEEDELVREADKHDYGLCVIVFDKAEWKEDYYRGSYRGTGTRKKTNQLRRKAA